MSTTRLTVHLLLLCLLAFTPSFAFTTWQAQDKLHRHIDSLEQAGDSLSVARQYYKLGKQLYAADSMAASNQALLSGISYAKSHPKALAYISGYLASNYSEMGDYTHALALYHTALQQSQLLQDHRMTANILINMAAEHSMNHSFQSMDSAISYALQAIHHKELAQDSSNMAFIYQQAGEMYKIAEEYELWEHYAEQAHSLIYSPAATSVSTTAAVYNDLGGIAEHKGDYATALLYYDSLLQHAKQHHYNNGIARAMNNAAIVYKKQGEYQKAIDNALASEAYDRYKPYQRIAHLNLLSELYWQQKQYPKALQYAQQGLALRQQKDFPALPDEAMRNSYNLYQAHKALQQGDSALPWLEAYHQTHDKLSATELKTRIHQLEISYQTAKKEATIAQLKAEQKSRQTILSILAVALILLALLIVFIILFYRSRQKTQQQNTELLNHRLLRAQLKPHFIFNALSAIQAYMMDNSNRDSIRYLNAFAQLMRDILDSSRSDLISLEKETNILNNYLKLQQLRMEHAFDYKIDTQPDIRPSETHIPPMLLQPFVENAVQHGIASLPKNTRGHISISFATTNQTLLVSIHDNGPGMQHTQSKNRNKTHKSLSMSIINERIQTINQLKHFDIKLNKHSSATEGTTIAISIAMK